MISTNNKEGYRNVSVFFKAPCFPSRHHSESGVHHSDRERASHHAWARGTAVTQPLSASLPELQLCVSTVSSLCFLSLKEQICRSPTWWSYCWSSLNTFWSVSALSLKPILILVPDEEADYTYYSLIVFQDMPWNCQNMAWSYLKTCKNMSCSYFSPKSKEIYIMTFNFSFCALTLFFMTIEHITPWFLLL